MIIIIISVIAYLAIGAGSYRIIKYGIKSHHRIWFSVLFLLLWPIIWLFVFCVIQREKCNRWLK